MRENPLYQERYDFGHLIAHQALPPSRSVAARSRRVRVRARTYSGVVTDIGADVIATYKQWVCIAQDDDSGVWNAWVHKSCVSDTEG